MELKAAHTHSPGPGSLNTGPRKLGHNASAEKTALSHIGEEPPVSCQAGYIKGERSHGQEPLVCCSAAPVPGGGHSTVAKSAWGSTWSLLVQVEGEQERAAISNTLAEKVKAEKSGVRPKGM